MNIIEGFFEFVFITIIVFICLRYIGKWLLRYYLKKKFGDSWTNFFFGGGASPNHGNEGNTNSSSHTSGKKSSKRGGKGHVIGDDEGTYVDFEEVKD